MLSNKPAISEQSPLFCSTSCIMVHSFAALITLNLKTAALQHILVPKQLQRSTASKSQHKKTVAASLVPDLDLTTAVCLEDP